MNRSALIAFVLSALGFLAIPAPIGWWMGRKAEAETAAGTQDGFPFAKAAVILGIAWMVFWLLALITFLTILV